MIASPCSLGDLQLIRCLLEIQYSRKETVYDLWKKGQATQEDYKDVMKLLALSPART